MSDGAELTEPGASGAPGPLAGVRVLELGGEQADYAGLLCAGLGASVIKVEPPEGSPGRRLGPFYQGAEDAERSLYFWGYNRGKRSVVLDLADPDGRARLDGLLPDADVLIDATPLGELAALGVDPAAHPALVHARLTPFGEDGPWAGFATSDLVSLALGGVVMNCGYDPDPAGHYDLPPIAPQAWHSFHIAGEQLVIGIVSALLYRLRSGLGQKVSVAIHEAVAKNTEIDLMSWVMLRQPVYRQTCRHALATITNPSISYTKDGRWNLSMHVGERDRRYLRPFMERYGLADGMTDPASEPVPGVRPVAGRLLGRDRRGGVRAAAHPPVHLRGPAVAGGAARGPAVVPRPQAARERGRRALAVPRHVRGRPAPGTGRRRSATR